MSSTVLLSMLILIGIPLLSIAVYFSLVHLMRQLGRKSWRFASIAGNTFGIVVTDQDSSSQGDVGVGSIVGVLHAIPGKTLLRDGPDVMNWKFIETGEEDPEHQNFLYKRLGLQDMGWWTYTLRLNTQRLLRFAWDEERNKEEPQTTPKVKDRRNVFYTGDMTVVVKQADTADKLGLDMEIDLTFEREYPVRSVVRLADSAAFLTSLVKGFVNKYTTSQPAEYYFGGQDVGTHRGTLAKDLETESELHAAISKELGLKICKVSLRDVSMKPEHVALLEKEVNARKTAAAELLTNTNKNTMKLADAETDMQAGLKANQVLKNRGEILAAIGGNAGTLAAFTIDRQAEALVASKLTTLVEGGGAVVSVGK